MNIKSVLRVYGQLRNLTDDETALLETLRAFTDAEREAFVEALQPQKTVKRATTERKIQHCVACDYTKRAAVHKDPNADGYHEFQSAQAEKKSKRAASLGTAIKGNLNQRREASVCAFVYADSSHCNQKEDNPVHDPKGGYAGYHEFQPAESQAAAGAGD